MPSNYRSVCLSLPNVPHYLAFTVGFSKIIFYTCVLKMTCKCIYLMVSIEINTCKKHFVFSGLEEDPVEFGFVVFKAFGVEFGVEHSKRLGSVSLSYKDTFITETVPLWCSVQLRLGSVPAVGKPSSLRRNPAAFGCWGLQQPPDLL